MNVLFSDVVKFDEVMWSVLVPETSLNVRDSGDVEDTVFVGYGDMRHPQEPRSAVRVERAVIALAPKKLYRPCVLIRACQH
jgi:hypothetical protein